MTNIILIGMRGSGKSVLGRKIAKTMKREHVDTDREIEKQERSSIAAIVKNKGWNYFRKTEKYVIRRISKFDNKVISTGGGVILDKENLHKLKKNGVFVYLEGSAEVLAARIEGDSERPDLGKEVAELLEDRRPKYEAAADIDRKSVV